MNNLNRNKDEKNSDITINKSLLMDWLSMEGKIILIPIYQRGYSWQVVHIETLFDDIINRMRDGSSHYFGIIAGKDISSSSVSVKNKIKIIDGQQRLTSSFLFFCAIRDIILQEKIGDISDYETLAKILKVNSEDKIEEYIYNPGGEITLNETFMKILKGNLKDIKKNNNFYENYLKFKELILKEQFNFEELNKLMNTFLYKFEIATIFFKTDKISNKKEMEIFENLNSKGKELSSEDLIKNFIFNLCSDELLIKNDDKEITLIFHSSITNELGEGKENGKFYKSLIQYNIGGEFNDNRQTQLTEFKKVVEKLFCIDMNAEIETMQEYKKLLTKFQDFAKIFYDVSKEKRKKIVSWLGVEKIILLCDEESKSNLFVGLTYLMFEFFKRQEKYDINTRLTEPTQKEIKRIYLTMMKAITKNWVITRRGDSNFRRIILKSIHSVRKDFLKNSKITLQDIGNKLKKYIANGLNSDKEFRLSIINNGGPHKSIKWLLILTEWEMSDFLNSGQHFEYKSPSIEHILPQTTNLWEEELKEKSLYNKEEFEINKEKNLEKLGNYFVLNKEKNSSAGNNIFSKKQEKYKANTSPLYNNPKYPDIDISRKTSWEFEDIQKRTEKLINYICEKVIKDNN